MRPAVPKTAWYFSLGAVIALPAFLKPIQNPDLFWHLSAGRRLAETGTFVREDFLSWTLAGAPWSNFEWLVQLIYHWLHSAGGFGGLFLLKAALLSACLVPLWGILKLNSRGSYAPALLPLFAFALIPHSDLRPDNFSLLFFMLTLWRLEALRAGRVPPSARDAAAGTALFALWGNLHPAFVLGLVLLAAYAAGAAREGAPLRRWLLLGGLCAAAPLVNPNGWLVYGAVLSHQSQAAELSRYIAEWARPSFGEPSHRPALLAAAAAAALLFRALFKKRPVPAAHLACLVFFTAAALLHARHMLFGVPVLTALGAGLLPPPEKGSRPAAQAAVVLLLFVFALPPLDQLLDRKGALPYRSPSAAAYLKEKAPALAGLKMLNTWAWGGWLGYELGPSGYRVFADGRYLFHRFLPELVRPFTAEEWAEFLERRGFGLAVLPPGRFPPPPEAEWALLFWDMKLAVYARRRSLPPAGAGLTELKYLRPGGDGEALELARAGRVGRRELEKEAARLGAFQDPADPFSLAGPLDGWRAALEGVCSSPGAACRP